MATSLWVARLIVSQATALKLSAKHQIDWRDVHDAIVCVPGLRYTWHRHPERGLRALVEIKIANRRCLAVLYPVSGGSTDTFALGSAYRDPGRAS